MMSHAPITFKSSDSPGFQHEESSTIDCQGVKPALHAYLASVSRDRDCECYRVGGVEDHVHLAVRLSRTIAVSDLLEALKKTSSKWMKAQSSEFANFSWQRGYGAFSVSPSHLEALLVYIDNQEEYHRKETFQDEHRRLLKKYGIPYDECYVWD